MSLPSLPPAALAQIYHTAAEQGTGTKYGVLAALTVAIYDAFICFGDEVEYIWKRQISAVTCIYIVNRYYAIAVGIISFMENVLPVFGGEVYVSINVIPVRSHQHQHNPSCERIKHFQPFAVGIPLTFTPNMIIGLRIYALYNRNRLLAVFIVTYMLGELGVALYIYLTPSLDILSLPGPKSITNSLALHACEPITSSKLTSMQAASFQFMQTIFDTIALLLILAKSYSEIVKLRAFDSIKTVIAKHGVLYYIIVFSLNLSWAIMILVATSGLKYSMAGLALGLAPVAANRLTLSLRAYGMNATVSKGEPLAPPDSGRERRNSWIGTSTFEIQTRHIQDDVDTETTASDNPYELKRMDVLTSGVHIAGGLDKTETGTGTTNSSLTRMVIA